MNCSCGVPLRIFRGEVDISYCSVVLSDPAGMMLSERLIGLLILNIPIYVCF